MSSTLGLVLAYIMLFAGGMMIGGAWSFYKNKRPWWSVVLLLTLGLLVMGVSFWRITTG